MSFTKKILLVDDDDEDKFILFDSLASGMARSDLLYAQDGEKAIALLKKLGDPSNFPCVIILDLNMPKMNGTETLRYLKSSIEFSNIPVIIYSTSENDIEKQKCMQIGAYAYITKPTSVTEWRNATKLFLSFCGL